jgi:putative phosphoesterase
MIALIADIHGNLPAFEAVLERIDELGTEKIYCAGDIVGYNPFPKECIQLMRKRRIESCMGNHDYGVVTGDTGLFNPYARAAVIWTRKTIGKDEMTYLKKLPLKLEPRKEMLLVHGSPTDPLWEYVKPHTPEAYVRSLFGEKDILILGHTHIPMINRYGKKLLVNPGSIGQPRDGDPKASFATLDVKNREARIIKVGYEIEKVASKIKEEGLPEFLAERLYEGY